MKKGLNKLLAAVMAAVMLLSGAMPAFAMAEIPARQMAYVDILDDIEISGTFWIDCDDYSPVDVPDVIRGAKYFEVCSDDDTIISVTDDLEVYGECCGATILTIYEYDKNWNYLGEFYYIGIVIDDWDKECATGYMTEAYDMYIEMNYKDEFYIYPEVETRGAINTYIILPSFYSGEATEIWGSDYVYAFAKGTDTYTAIVVDTNGNYEYVDVTFDVSFTFFQWVIWILLLGFLWY